MRHLAPLPILALVALSVLAPAPARAQTPVALTVQGYLTDAEGRPVTGAVDVTFRLYANGEEIWSDVRTVTPEGGYYTVLLGDPAAGKPLPASAFDDPGPGTRAFGIQVGEDPEMTPRLPISFVPYAVRALQSAGALRAQSVPWEGIEGAPTEFAPGAHTHPGADITSEVARAASVPWEGIEGAPTEFTPAAHTHAGSDITSAVSRADSCGSADSVAWSNVANVPAGFADGVDNDTQYTPGEGLLMSTPTAFAVDFSAVARKSHTHGGAEIVDGSIGIDDLGSSSVGQDEIARDAVKGHHVAPGTLDGSDIAAGTITGAASSTGGGHLAWDTITGDNIYDGSVGDWDIAPGAIRGGPSWVGAHIGYETITNDNVAIDTLTGDRMASWTALRVSDYEYATPKTRPITVPASAFVPIFGSPSRSSGTVSVSGVWVDAQLAAPVVLEAGQSVSEMECHFFDGDGAGGSSVSVTLVETSYGSEWHYGNMGSQWAGWSTEWSWPGYSVVHGNGTVLQAYLSTDGDGDSVSLAECVLSVEHPAP